MRAGSSTIDGRGRGEHADCAVEAAGDVGIEHDVADRLVESGGGERGQPHLADGGDLGFGETGGSEGDDRLTGTTRQRPDETVGQRLALWLELVRQVLVEARRPRRRSSMPPPPRLVPHCNGSTAQRGRQRERLERSGELAPGAAERVVAVEAWHARVRHDRRRGRRICRGVRRGSGDRRGRGRGTSRQERQ